jgi:hypothetical protein
MKKGLNAYLGYLREESEEMQNLHSVLIASILTGIFIAVYLYLVRGISPPLPVDSVSREYRYTSTEELKPTVSSLINTKTATSSESDLSPIDSLGQLFIDIGSELGKTKEEIVNTWNSVGQDVYQNPNK